MKDSRVVLAEVSCDLCGASPEVIFDAPTRGGRWGYQCERCLSVHGFGLTGMGTKHANRPKEKKTQVYSFSVWMSKTERIFEMKAGIDVDSVLGDWNSRDRYDDGMTPLEAANELIDDARNEWGVEAF